MSDPAATAYSAGPGLHLAGQYDRIVAAGLARVWENVLDWEHLPALHAGQFHSISLLDSGPSGWLARVVNQPGDAVRAQVIQVTIDREAGVYCSATVEGPGAGSEIWTTLTPIAADSTAVSVAFHVPEPRPARLVTIGHRYAEIYARLWDEDEAMMVERDRALAARRNRPRDRAEPLDLGSVDSVRAALPMVVEYGGERFRIIQLDGELVVHAATCPHWLGPLDVAEVINGCITCPWHGYRFDVSSGASLDGRDLSLPTPPRIGLQGGRVILLK